MTSTNFSETSKVPYPLHGTGDNEENRKVLALFEKALPYIEFRALCLWLDNFYGYQQTWILDQSRNAASVKSRQIGGSLAYSAAAILWAVFFGEHVSLVSVGQREAQEILKKCFEHASVLAALGSKLARTSAESQERLEFESKGRIMALPATSGGRGYAGHVILDEFAYYQNPDQIFDAAAGSVTHGYKLRLISTPNGVNRFHDIIHGGLKGWRIYSTNLDEAIADGINLDPEACLAQVRGDRRLFGQVFMCQFLDDNLQYFTSDIVTPAFSEFPTYAEKAGVCFGGLDIGHQRDLTVLSIIKREGPMRWLHHIETHRNPDNIDRMIDELAAKAFGKFKVQRFCIDSTGLGSIPAARIRKNYGRRVEQINFSTTVKESLCTGLYDALAHEEFKLPSKYYFNGREQVADLVTDLYSIRRITSAAGIPRYDAERNKLGHADRAWALMLSMHAGSKQSAMFAAFQKRKLYGSAQANSPSRDQHGSEDHSAA